MNVDDGAPAIRLVPWSTHKDRLLAIRRTVFIEEQAVPEAEEIDGRDPQCDHFLAVDESGHDLGCARLTPEGQIGRMAVIKGARGRSIGRLLLDATVEHARHAGFASVFLHAQVHALAFYRRMGFSEQGDRFFDAGIEHLAMTRILDESSARPTAFANETDAANALVAAMNGAQREALILHPTMDPALFADEAFCDAFSRFARASAHNRIRMLLYRSHRLTRASHALLPLIRRLDQRVSIRRVPEDYATDERAFLCCDARGYWLLPNVDSVHGLLNPNDAVMAKRLRERFDYLWERSKTDPELRVLKL
ncbi:MAG: GNAT family N-acetyltransferase [Pseudomonadota bacterium]